MVLKIAEKISNRLFPPMRRINLGGRGVINLIDVGSVGGLTSTWRRHSRSIRFLMNFEPRDKPQTSKNIVTCNTALWESDCEKDFYIYKGINQTGSSLFEQNHEYVHQHFDILCHNGPSMLAETWFERSELERTERVLCRKLDSVITEYAPHVPFHFLKIDAQGAEYNILKGAEKLLTTSCLGLHLELFTVPLYKGIRLLPDVRKFLSKYGFSLVKMYPAHGTFDSQHDCVFMKTHENSRISELIKTVYGLS